MTDWLSFYERFFASADDARAFVDACESTNPPDHAAKLIMHQGQRLISLAQDIPSIRPSRESLQVFFLIVCAEAIAKLDTGSELGSRESVRRFVCTLVPEPHRSAFGNGFTTHSHDPLGPQGAADILYDVRCDVAHEGNYWSFALRHGSTPMLNSTPAVISRLSADELVEIVARGCIVAAQRHL